MIAVISSTLFPSDKSIFGGIRSSYSPSERIQQTVNTIASLKEAGIDDIYLVDNSDKCYHEQICDEFNYVNVLTFDSYQFNNRGLSEILLLLSSIRYLPEEVPILKISGRYRLNQHFNVPIWHGQNFIIRGHSYHKRYGTVSTRCYITRNKRILEQISLNTLYVMYNFNSWVKGPRSFLDLLKRKFIYPIFPETTQSIELGMALALKRLPYTVEVVDRIGLEGHIAGFSSRDHIVE